MYQLGKYLHIFYHLHKQKDQVIIYKQVHMFLKLDHHNMMDFRGIFIHKSMLSYLQTIHLDSQQSSILLKYFNKHHKIQMDIYQHNVKFIITCTKIDLNYIIRHISFVNSQHNIPYYNHLTKHIFQEYHL